jgi:hypothetical protein
LQEPVEVDHVLGDTTARELQKLRQYCANHRGELNAKFGDNMNKHALMHRFADGDYLGVPYAASYASTDSNEDRYSGRGDGGGRRGQGEAASGGWSTLGRVVRVVVVCIIIVAVIVVNCLIISELM